MMSVWILAIAYAIVGIAVATFVYRDVAEYYADVGDAVMCGFLGVFWPLIALPALLALIPLFGNWAFDKVRSLVGQ